MNRKETKKQSSGQAESESYASSPSATIVSKEIAMSQSATAIPAFDHLPEVNALGTATLQRLSDEWLKTSLAKRHGVKADHHQERTMDGHH